MRVRGLVGPVQTQEQEGIWAHGHPISLFTSVHLSFVVTGRGLDRAKVERAIELSAETYCSASAMIEKTAEITHELEIVDSAKP